MLRSDETAAESGQGPAGTQNEESLALQCRLEHEVAEPVRRRLVRILDKAKLSVSQAEKPDKVLGARKPRGKAFVSFGFRSSAARRQETKKGVEGPEVLREDLEVPLPFEGGHEKDGKGIVPEGRLQPAARLAEKRFGFLGQEALGFRPDPEARRLVPEPFGESLG